MQIVIWVEWPLLNSSNDFRWWIFPKLWWRGLTVCSPANVGLEAKTLGWPPPSTRQLMFAAEMLRHFAAEIWNSLCNLICSSSYKTWKCCNNLKFTIPRFCRRFCFFSSSVHVKIVGDFCPCCSVFFSSSAFPDISTIRVQFPIFTFCESARQSTDLKTWSQFPF